MKEIEDSLRNEIDYLKGLSTDANDVINYIIKNKDESFMKDDFHETIKLLSSRAQKFAVRKIYKIASLLTHPSLGQKWEGVKEILRTIRITGTQLIYALSTPSDRSDPKSNSIYELFILAENLLICTLALRQAKDVFLALKSLRSDFKNAALAASLSLLGVMDEFVRHSQNVEIKKELEVQRAANQEQVKEDKEKIPKIIKQSRKILIDMMKEIE